MTESKKPTTKQVSIASFFSPKPVKTSSSPPRPPTELMQQTPVSTPVKVRVTTTESPAIISIEALSTPSPASRKRPAPSQAENDSKLKPVDVTVVSAYGEEKAMKVSQKRSKRAAIKKQPAKPVLVKRGVSPHEQTGMSDDDSMDSEDEGKVSSIFETNPVETEDVATERDAEKEIEEPVPLPDPQLNVKIRRRRTQLTPPAPAVMKPKKPSKKEKEPVVSPVASPEKLIAPIDPVVRARIASYQQKVDDLNRLCERLVRSSCPDDAVLQEIYGLGLDVDLDKPDQEQLQELQAAWRLYVECLNTATSTAPELPSLLKHFVARTIQSRNDGLPQLVDRLTTLLDSNSLHITGSASVVALEMEIKMLAQRTPYGSRPAKANLYEDTTPEALWCWEVNNVELHFSEDAQKEIRRQRRQRKRTGGQLKSLCRVLQLLSRTPSIDEVKVANEEAKISKFGSQVESELLKARDRERKEQEKHRKEQEKAHAAEEKKRLEQEKQLAKEEERKRKEDEQVAERMQAEKRRKSLVSYFTAVAPSDASSSNAPAADTSVPVSLSVSKKAETMAQMDLAIDYLVSNSSRTRATSSAINSSSSLLKRKSALVPGRSGPWSSKQHRDAKLGVMKLLQFHENYRPAYYGTFHKRSLVFRRGRRPFAQYQNFDYMVDSEEEWEEEEPGESLSDADSDIDEDDGEDQLDYGDDWLAYEDEVEYVDGENERDEDDVVMADDEEDVTGAHDANIGRKKRRRRVASENKKQKLTKLVPEITGPFVCIDEFCDEHLIRYQAELLDAAPNFVSPLIQRARTREAVEAVTKMSTPSPSIDSTKSKKNPPEDNNSRGGLSVTPESAPTTPHKPPVKRKIHAQLVSVALTNASPATIAAAVTDQRTASSTTKSSDLASSTQSVAPRVSPVQNGIANWLKNQVQSTDSSASTTATSPLALQSSSTNSSVET